MFLGGMNHSSRPAPCLLLQEAIPESRLCTLDFPSPSLTSLRVQVPFNLISWLPVHTPPLPTRLGSLGAETEVWTQQGFTSGGPRRTLEDLGCPRVTQGASTKVLGLVLGLSLAQSLGVYTGRQQASVPPF